MLAKKIKENIYWVGSIDWNLRNFHGYKTSCGSSYNAYLILDEKNVLIDTSKEPLFEQMLDRISSIIDPSKIDIIISNHVEMDHSGNIKNIIKYCPNAQVLASTKGVNGLIKHYDTSLWNLKAVSDGESISIGKNTLTFYHTPMIHWPDNMVAFCKEQEILFSNDAFGQHIAFDELFVSKHKKDTVFYEAQKYYANIVYPYSTQVIKVLNTLSSIKIDMIAPSHGIIWDKYVEDILNKYKSWANNENNNSAIIVYDTMWNSTKLLADAISSGFELSNTSYLMQSLKENHISDLVTLLLDAKYIAIGSSVLNNNVLPTVASFLTYVKGLMPKNKVAFIFGSYGWNNKGLKDIEDLCAYLNWKKPYDSFLINYIPTEKNLNELKNIIYNLTKEY